MTIARLQLHQASVLLGTVILTAGLAANASAQGRSQVSADLAWKLVADDGKPTRVIITGSQSKVDELAARHNLRIYRRLPTGAAVDVPAGRLGLLAEDMAVHTLSSDQTVRSHMSVTNASIGADLVHAGVAGAPGLTGAGVGVAILDSGVSVVPELRGKVIASVDFTEEQANGQDKFGHGTHVAGIVAANGNAADADTVGVAPGAVIINVRVLDSKGEGRASDVIAAIDWVIANRFKYNIRVINLSLGAPVMQSWRLDPLCQAVERAFRAGIVVVAAAGNHGKTADGKTLFGGIVSPAPLPTTSVLISLKAWFPALSSPRICQV